MTDNLKLWVFSDLHQEFSRPEAPPTDAGIPDADICVVAGDVTRPVAESVEWLAARVLPWMEVIYVAGNHEHYHGSIKEGLEDGRSAAARHPGMHFLENDAVTLHGVRFLGCTLWTDYNFYADAKTAMKVAANGINDHKLILTQQSPAMRFMPEDARDIHLASRAWLEGELAAGFDGPTVVVTHHCPHEQSVHQKFLGGAYNPAFVSDLSGVMATYEPDLWIHGHTHYGFDYKVGKTRVVCNPVGYLGENPMFDPRKIVEIPVPAFVRTGDRTARF